MQYQFVKYAIHTICAKRFIRTAVDLQKVILRMLAVPTKLSTDKMDEFCGMCLQKSRVGEGGVILI